MAAVRLPIGGKLLSEERSVLLAALDAVERENAVAVIVEHLRWAAKRGNHRGTPRRWYAARFKR